MKMSLFRAVGIASTLLMSQYMALAGPSSCWFQQTTGARRSPSSYCDVEKFGTPQTQKGLPRWQFPISYRVITDGVTRTINLGKPVYFGPGGNAEVLIGLEQYTARWELNDDGDVILIFSDGSWFAFRIPLEECFFCK